jgi:PAS domain S-box-containing protein
VEGLVLSLHDVTEEVRALQRSEETEQARAREARLLDAIEEATPSLLAYLDRELRLVHVNTAFAAHFGMCGEEMIGRSLGEIAPGSEGVVGLLVGVRETGETVVRSEALRVISRRPELGRRYFDNAFVPVKDEHGHVEGIVISTIDVTEKVEQREKLLQAERARTHFAETVAAEINHRMKNNLMMVAGLLHLQAMQQGLDEPARRLIDTAAARISSIAAVHEELYERRQEAANVVDLLRRMARTTAEAVGAADVEMTVDGDELYCGPKAATSLSIVASELVLNGLKHGGPDEDGRHRIKILARRSADTLRLSVWNSGNPVCYDAGCGAKPRMGMKLIDEVVCGQFGGGYSLRPEGFGTLAEVVLSEGKLREAEEMA